MMLAWIRLPWIRLQRAWLESELEYLDRQIEKQKRVLRALP
jgi:hypothetical protein